jgi:hypothetical protein
MHLSPSIALYCRDIMVVWTAFKIGSKVVRQGSGYREPETVCGWRYCVYEGRGISLVSLSPIDS